MHHAAYARSSHRSMSVGVSRVPKCSHSRSTSPALLGPPMRSARSIYLSVSSWKSVPQERHHFALEDLSNYALLVSSGCYRLPNSGPFSDDAVAMEQVRMTMRTFVTTGTPFPSAGHRALSTCIPDPRTDHDSADDAHGNWPGTVRTMRQALLRKTLTY